jgi:hypothetical protein
LRRTSRAKRRLLNDSVSSSQPDDSRKDENIALKTGTFIHTHIFCPFFLMSVISRAAGVGKLKSIRPMAIWFQKIAKFPESRMRKNKGKE